MVLGKIKTLFIFALFYYEAFKGRIFVSGLKQFENPRVLLSLGEMEGSVFNSRSGKTIFAFRGIRYAKSPINELRFEPPQPIDGWNGLYDATSDGLVCPQLGVNRNHYSEDCLFLNVYTGKLPFEGDQFSRPVIVYFHGGQLESGSSHSSVVGPQYLLDKDIVLVTVNYRLGLFGFFSLGTEEVPGNNGLKDQVEALRWVKQNIINYGGDPNLITIMGSSVIYHLISPLSKGLFHRAIALDLLPIGQFETINDQLDITFKVANFLNCSNNNHYKTLVGCLKAQSVFDIVSSYSKLTEFGIHPLIKWRPVVEYRPNKSSFLTDDPFKLIQAGKYTNVPIIIGITDHEFDYIAYDDIQNERLLNQIDQNFTVFAPIAFFYERDTNYSHKISSTLRSRYFGESKIDYKKLFELGKLYKDGITGFRTHKLAHLLSSAKESEVYFYKFAYKGMYSNFYKTDYESFSVPIGSVFEDDLIYMFYNSQRFPLFTAKDPDSRIVDRFTTMWAYFAKTGSPTPEKDYLIENVIWKTMTDSNKKYMMDIHCHLVMKEELEKDKYDMWNSLLLKNEY